MAERFFPADEHMLQTVVDWSRRPIVGPDTRTAGALAALDTMR